MMPKLKNPNLLKTDSYINGKWAKGKHSFAVKNPLDGATVATISEVGSTETKQAIKNAHRAFTSWKNTSAVERSSYLKRWADLIDKNQEDLATILTLEEGKTLEQSTHELMGSGGILNWAAEEARRITGYTTISPDPNRRFMTLKQPLGVVAAITPCNFPSVLPLKKCAPALAAGCTVVLKPAEDTPLSALALAHLAHEAGVPPGVFNVLTCASPEAVGQELTSNPLVRKASFTGSTEVGKKIISASGSTVKNITMELGGNCPVLIFEDADLDLAAQQTFWFKINNAGQCCNNINRFLIHTNVYDTFVKKFLAFMDKYVKLGPGIDPSTSIGPLINEQGIAKVEELVDEALSKGAIAVQGGARSSIGPLFYEATLLTDVTPKMRMYREEIFGPVAACYRFSSEEEAIHMANDTNYGLAAYVFTENIGRSWRVAEGFEAGSIGVNTCDVVSESLPFGGWKESGMGRENGAIDGLDNYLENKSLVIGKIIAKGGT